MQFKNSKFSVTRVQANGRVQISKGGDTVLRIMQVASQSCLVSTGDYADI